MTVIDGLDTDQPGGQNSTDRELIDAVRRGDASAYAELYELYEHSIRSVAGRLTRDRYEADDVVSEVFANTLRAIQRGGGPRDDFAVYALRSVRNTVTKLRTRTDSARALPTEHNFLDRPSDHDLMRIAGDVEVAFQELPERFQSVLWSTCIEGHTPTDVAEGTELDPGAVASLSNRARRALGRSYLRVHTQRPCRHPDCSRVRANLPGYVQHMAAPGTVRRIESHLRSCTDCQSVRDDMTELNGKLRSAGWMTLLAASGRQVLMAFSAVNAPIVATAAAPIVALIVAGAVLSDHQNSETARAAAAQSMYESSDPIDAPSAFGATTGATNVPVTTRAIESTATTTATTTVTTTVPVVLPAATPSATDTLLDDAPPTQPVPAGPSPVGMPAGGPTTTVEGVLPTPLTGVVGATPGGTNVVTTILTDPNVGGAVATVVDDTTDAVDGLVDGVVETVDGVGTVLGVDLSPVLDPVGGVVDSTLLTVDDLAGTVGGVVDGGVVGGLVGTVLPSPTPTTTTMVSGTTVVPSSPTTTVPGLLPGLIDGLGGLLGGG
ncbi:MAG TPA: sigma-70 family RNA polymerase sigma factor [Ilumatobacter sp.]|nr:sigma-70 family RNA polymerase sigma factor [Ilumatobacter sp.]